MALVAGVLGLSPAGATAARADSGCGGAHASDSLDGFVDESAGAVTTGAKSAGPDACGNSAAGAPTATAASAVRQCAILSAALPGVAEWVAGGDPFAPTLAGPEVAIRRATVGQLVVGGVYLRYCAAGGGPWVLVGAFTFRGGEDPTPAPAPEDVARLALARIRLPAPRPFTAPPRDRLGLVGIATWLWVDPAQWHALTATAAVPGLGVAATVTPVRTRWDMGEGRGKRAAVCDGPGKPYDPGVKDALQRTFCSYVFQWASDDHHHELAGADSDDVYHASATITWRVHWTDSLGGAGDLADMSTTTPFDLRVGEIQAVVCDDTPLGACQG